MNNPIMLVDPDGRKISGDTAMVDKLENAAGSIIKSEEARQVRLQKRIDKRIAKDKSTDKLEAKMSDSKARVDEIKGLLSDISNLRKSTQEYHINSNWTPTGVSGIDGETVYNPQTGAIDVNITASYGIAGLAHELTHAFQFDQGLTDFNLDGINRGYLHDITDEQAAYRRQFAINGGIKGKSSRSQIADSCVRGLSTQHTYLPAFHMNKKAPLQKLFMFHGTINLKLTYYPSFGHAIKSYQDAKKYSF